MPALIFDLDGTLIDTVYAHVFAWQRAFAEAGMAIDGWRIHRRIGMSGGLFARAAARELGRAVTPEEAELLQLRHGELFREFLPQRRPLPGAIELLTFLRENDIVHGIATSNWQTQAAVHEVKEHSLPVLQRQWQESQANLGTYLRLYQIHSATQESGVLENQAVLAELARLKRQGIAIGLSLSGPEQGLVLQRAGEIVVDGARLFDSVQATWNLLEPSAGPALQKAHAAGMGVIVKEALANGRLTRRNDDPGFAQKLALLERHAARLSTTIDALALAAVLAEPWADVVLSGAATAAQLASNLQALHVRWDEEATALAAIAESPQGYWGTRKRLPWA